MRVELITPSPPGLMNGNRVTAQRWARLLRELGCEAHVRERYADQPADALVALHAVKTAGDLRRFRRRHPDRPALVALTGTDLYGAFASARRSLATADRIIALQQRAAEALPARLRERTRVIYQSARPLRSPPPRVSRWFQVAVVAHLRAVKDPLRAARAARTLPAASRVRVVGVGRALSEPLARRATAETRDNPRYRWLGERPRARARRVVAASHLVAITSRAEGSCNVLSEALADGVPVLATRIPGLLGTLPADYPGLFEVGDTRGLTALMRRAEEDRRFYRHLARACRALAPLASPRRERAAWRTLLKEIS